MTLTLWLFTLANAGMLAASIRLVRKATRLLDAARVTFDLNEQMLHGARRGGGA